MIRFPTALLMAAFALAAQPASAEPNPPSVPPGVSAALTLNPVQYDAHNFAFTLKIQFNSATSFWLRLRTSKHGWEDPFVLSGNPGDARERSPQSIFLPNANDAPGAWAEWWWAAAGPNDAADGPPNTVPWRFGGRVYAAPQAQPAQPAAKPPANVSSVDGVDAKLFPDPVCRGAYRFQVTLVYGATGAAGWLQFVRSNGTSGPIQELRSAPGAPAHANLHDSFKVTLSPQPPGLAEYGPVVRDSIRFFDMGPAFATSKDGMFPPPVSGPGWRIVASAHSPAQQPHAGLKDCGR